MKMDYNFKFFLRILEKIAIKNVFIICSSLDKSVNILLPVPYKQFHIEKRFYVKYLSSFDQNTEKICVTIPLKVIEYFWERNLIPDFTSCCWLYEHASCPSSHFYRHIYAPEKERN